MSYLLIEYPKCSTCQKAKKFLESNHIPFQDRHIIEDRPTIEELEEWISLSNREIKSFFNTSGKLYQQRNLKEKLETLSDKEKIELLASDGMLIKRPLLIGDNIVLSGFKESVWEQLKK